MKENETKEETKGNHLDLGNAFKHTKVNSDSTFNMKIRPWNYKRVNSRLEPPGTDSSLTYNSGMENRFNMCGIVQGTTRLPGQNIQSRFVLVMITLSILIALDSAVVLADDAPTRRERAAVVFSDQGNTLYDNGTLVFDVAMNEDVDVYLLDDVEYEWEGLGDRAAGWVWDGVVRAVPPSEVIGKRLICCSISNQFSKAYEVVTTKQ